MNLTRVDPVIHHCKCSFWTLVKKLLKCILLEMTWEGKRRWHRQFHVLSSGQIPKRCSIGWIFIQGTAHCAYPMPAEVHWWCDLYSFIGRFCLSFLLMNESILIQKNAASLQDKDKDMPAASSQVASSGPSVRFSIMISRWSLAHSHVICSALYSPGHQEVCAA